MLLVSCVSSYWLMPAHFFRSLSFSDKHPRGEICVRGAGVFAGYYKDEANTNAAIIDGWLHTGDVGRFNSNGLFHHDIIVLAIFDPSALHV